MAKSAKKAATKKPSKARASKKAAKSSKSSAIPLKTVAGQPSWRLATKEVELYVTRTGGHIGPVTFTLGKRKVSPYSVAPWAVEKLDPQTPAILKVLRGDFFCAPFGGNGTPWKGQKHPVHGATANVRWTALMNKATPTGAAFVGHMTDPSNNVTVSKALSLQHGHTAIYSWHRAVLEGPMNFGHHAMLKFPDVEGSGLISTSRFVHGQVFPEAFERPENRGYQSLKPGAEFTTLASVPLLNGGTADLTRYPARRGFEDLVLLVADPSLKLAWTAVSFPSERYVWFALRNPQVLRQTIFWISNGGRHYPPWNGRHVNVMGLEDVTSCFHYGLAESVEENVLSRKGYPTFVNVTHSDPLDVNYIMGVAETPAGFGRVAAIESTEGGIRLVDEKGTAVTTAVDVDFLYRTYEDEADTLSVK